MKEKHVPMRMCAGCRERFEKRQLIRVVKSPQGEISIDKTGKKAGRGAYLCCKDSCLKTALKKHAFDRVFQMQVGEEIYEQLRQELEHDE